MRQTASGYGLGGPAPVCAVVVVGGTGVARSGSVGCSADSGVERVARCGRMGLLLHDGDLTIGLLPSTAMWTVPGGTWRALVTRSMRSSHRAGGEAAMMSAASRRAL